MWPINYGLTFKDAMENVTHNMKILGGKSQMENIKILTVMYQTRREAEEVLDALDNTINLYGYASVTDFYDIIGISARYGNNIIGWTNLKDAMIRWVSNGYALKLPKPHRLEDSEKLKYDPSKLSFFIKNKYIQEVRNGINILMRYRGQVSVADISRFMAEPVNPRDEFRGWRNLNGISYDCAIDGYILRLPEPIQLSESLESTMSNPEPKNNKQPHGECSPEPKCGDNKAPNMIIAIPNDPSHIHMIQGYIEQVGKIMIIQARDKVVESVKITEDFIYVELEDYHG